MKVEEIKKDGKDSVEEPILTVYYRAPPTYAIYRTRERVMVHFSDQPEEEQQQRRALCRVNPVRGEINGLIDGWRGSRRRGLQARASHFDRRVADGLSFAVKDDEDGAAAVLTGVRADIIDERTSWARFQYLIAASLASALVICITAVISRSFRDESWALWMAPAAGTVGAFFSVAIAIRSRTVLTDLHLRDNISDAALRICIGGIAALVLVALLKLNAFKLALGDYNASGPITAGQYPDYSWLLPLVVGFVAGFSERLVPDLLDRAGSGSAGPAVRPVITGARSGSSSEAKQDQAPPGAAPAQTGKVGPQLVPQA